MQNISRREQVYGYGLLVVSALTWGCSSVLIKLCYSNGFTISSMVFLRYTVALPLFVVLVKMLGESLWPPRHTLRPLLLLSANMLVCVLLFYLSVKLLPATLAVLFFCAYPSFTNLLHMLLQLGPLGLPRVLALVISACGLILLYWSSAAGLSLLGVLCALVAAALQAVQFFQIGSLLPSVSAARLNLFCVLITAVAAALFYVVQGALSGGWDLGAISGAGWIYLLILSMITVCSSFFMTLGMVYVGAADTSLVLLLEPLTTAGLAYVVFGDLLSPWQICGGLLVLLAVALPAVSNVSRHKQLSQKTRAVG